MVSLHVVLYHYLVGVKRGSMATTATPDTSAPGSNPGLDPVKDDGTKF